MRRADPALILKCGYWIAAIVKIRFIQDPKPGACHCACPTKFRERRRKDQPERGNPGKNLYAEDKSPDHSAATSRLHHRVSQSKRGKGFLFYKMFHTGT